MREKGVSAIYGPGTNIPAAASEIVDLIRLRRQQAA
ncbi:MAG: methylmalonyl-CoA mutase cobalamin-binding subunit [Alphaproteobacteria bacterium]